MEQIDNTTTIPELRLLFEGQVLKDLCALNSDAEYLTYLKNNRIRFTLANWDYRVAKRCYYEVVHIVGTDGLTTKSKSLRLLVKHVAVSDYVNNGHWVATQYVYLSFNKALKSGIQLILDERAHEGSRIEYELSPSRPRAA